MIIYQYVRMEIGYKYFYRKGSWVGLLYLEEFNLEQTRKPLKHSLSISDKYITGQPHNITVKQCHVVWNSIKRCYTVVSK